MIREKNFVNKYYMTVACGKIPGPLELKDKIPKAFPYFASAEEGSVDFEVNTAVSAKNDKLNDVRDALAVLGYSRSEIAAAMKNLDMSLDVEELIKAALAVLMRN